MSQLRLRRRSKRIGGAGLRWALSTVAPWALSAGLLVSFTASAGQNAGPPGEPMSLVLRTAPGPLSGLAEGPSLLVAASAFHLPQHALPAPLHQARLSFQEPENIFVVDPRRPREDMKTSASAFPQVDRSAKGDQLVGLRPTLTRTGPPGELERMVFGDTQPGLISGGFSPDSGEGPEGPQVGFEKPLLDEGVTDPALSDASPVSRPRIENIDGATPTVASETARSSSTPAVNPGAAMASLPTPAPLPPPMAAETSIAKTPQPDERPDLRLANPSERQIYTALITPENMAKEQRCLAEAVYFEARSESLRGQAAVAQVVLNRVKSGLYPTSVCGVVYQNRNRHLACQFTFACEGKALRITEPAPWRDATRIAREVYDGTTYLEDVGASTHYHADYVRPRWARKLKKMDTIGRHTFYRLRPGQT